MELRLKSRGQFCESKSIFPTNTFLGEKGGTFDINGYMKDSNPSTTVLFLVQRKKGSHDLLLI